MDRLIYLTLLWLTKKRIRRFVVKNKDCTFLTPSQMQELFSLIPAYVLERLTHEKLVGRSMTFPGTLKDLRGLVGVCTRIVSTRGSIPPFVLEENFRDIQRVTPVSEILEYAKPGHILCETYEELMRLHKLVDGSYEEKRYHYEGRLVDVYTAFSELVIDIIFAN